MAKEPIKFLDRTGTKTLVREIKGMIDSKESLTPWQKEFLTKQEEAERLSKFTATLAATPGGNEFTGQNIEFTLTATTKYDGAVVSSVVTPTSNNLADVEFTNGVGHYVYPTPMNSNGKESINFNVKCVYTDDLGSIEKSASASQTRYAPIKFLSSEQTPDSAAIAGATQKQVKSAVKGDYSISFNQGDYVWVCIPSFLTPTKFTSGGFGVPMEAPVTVAVTIGNTAVTYKCYRTTGKPQTSPMSLTIE